MISRFTELIVIQISELPGIIVNKAYGQKNGFVIFLENNLGLSKELKIKGRVVKHHDEALFFWKELIECNILTSPFSVVYVDSHADLGFGGTGNAVVRDDIILRDKELKKSRYCHGVEYNGFIYDMNCANYLLYPLWNLL